MKALLLLAAALPLAACASVPVTRTAANSDACIAASVRPTTVRLVTPADRADAAEASGCKQLASWAPRSRSYANEAETSGETIRTPFR